MSRLVYFLRPVGQIGPIKIGCSKLPALRLELIWAVPGTHPDKRTLHGMFVKHHIHGGWFGASKELLALIDYCEQHGELPELPKAVKFPRVRHVGHRGRAAGKTEPGELSPEEDEVVGGVPRASRIWRHCEEIASDSGISLSTVCRYIRQAGGELRRGAPKGRQSSRRGVADKQRAQEMQARYLGGETLQQIGDSYGITRERVRQILRKFNVPSLGNRPEHYQKAHPLTAAEIEAVELYKRDTPPTVACERTGIAQYQLRAALRRLGVEAKGTGYWLTRSDDAEITERTCALYLQGLGATEIVRLVPQLKFPERVYRYLKKGGVAPRNDRQRGSVEAKAPAIIAARQAGNTVKEIAATFGCSAGAVDNLLRRHGVALSAEEKRAIQARAVSLSNRRRAA